MKYEFLDHTADAKFRAYGENLEKAFENAGLAVFSILINPDVVKPIISKEISISSKTKESLLYDFIDELLFLLDTEGLVLNKIKNLKIDFKDNKFSLTCVVKGDSFKKYNFIHGNVKSVTYTEMIIDENFSEQENKKIMLQVVVDL